MQKNKFFRPIKINDSNSRREKGLIDIYECISWISSGGFIKKRLLSHFDLYDCCPKGTLNENLWVKIFNEDLGLGEWVDGFILGWDPESHKIGADIIVPSLMCPRISCKTGKISKMGRKKPKSLIREDHKVTYSSHRLTKHCDFEGILNFLNYSHCDITFLLSPHVVYGKYYWIVHKNLNFQNIKWGEMYSKKGNQSGWVGSGGDEGIINAKITKNLSSQLWIELALSSNSIIHMEEICV